MTTSVAIDSGRIPALAADPAVVDIEPWVAPQLLDERAAQIVAARLTGGTTPTGAGLSRASSTAQGFPATPQNFAIDITDEGVDKGVQPVPAGSHPDFYRNGNPTSPSRHRVRARGHRVRYRRPRLRRPRDQRRLNRRRVQQADRAPPSRTRRASTTGSGSRRGRRSGRRRSSTAPAVFDVTTSITALRDQAYAQRRPDLEQLVGCRRRRRLQRPAAGVRRARPRRPAGRRRQPGDDQGRSPPATPAPARNTIGSPGHGEERDHGRRLGERARRSAPPTAAASRTAAPTTPRTSSTSPAAARPTTAG